ncbi:hypothetical protein [Pseudomonas phoenicis]
MSLGTGPANARGYKGTSEKRFGASEIKRDAFGVRATAGQNPRVIFGGGV